jgi:hypothetical protein
VAYSEGTVDGTERFAPSTVTLGVFTVLIFSMLAHSLLYPMVVWAMVASRIFESYSRAPFPAWRK